MDQNFYVYIWYKDGEPVYVGKGTGKRAYRDNSIDVEIYKNNLTEDQAFELEKHLIKQFGRKDKNEGPLLNLTDGGGIAFSTLYWEGSILQEKHRVAILKRDTAPGWLDGAVTRAKHAAAVRRNDWQDSVYLIRTPRGEIFQMKTQELKEYCAQNNLDFDQMKHIARGNITKRKQSRHYGYLVEYLYNKVTKQSKDKAEIVKGWQR